MVALKTVVAMFQWGRSQRSAAPARVHQRLIECHWAALASSGVPASKVIEFLQPFADAEGLSVYELPVTQINGTSTAFGVISAKTAPRDR